MPKIIALITQVGEDTENNYQYSDRCQIANIFKKITLEKTQSRLQACAFKAGLVPCNVGDFYTATNEYEFAVMVHS